MIKRSFFGLLIFCLPLVSFAQEPDFPTVEIETDSGTITLMLYNETPLHRDNFLKLARDGYYNGTTFHRVIETFMIQGGDPNSKPGVDIVPGNGGPGYTIPAEFNDSLYHKRGALCAARQPDQVNPERESSGSQFYIVQGRTFNQEQLADFDDRINSTLRNKIAQSFFEAEENKEYLSRLQAAQKDGNNEEIQTVMDEVEPIIDARLEGKKFSFSEQQIETYTTIGGAPHLDTQYTVFGEVVDGIEVVDKIASVKKDGQTPIEPFRMTVKVVD